LAPRVIGIAAATAAACRSSWQNSRRSFCM
jgi:hypothetical protein